jgi:hypothetical protein
MGRQSSSPDSLSFENIYQLPFFLSAVPPEYEVSPQVMGGLVSQTPPEVPPCPRVAANFDDVLFSSARCRTNDCAAAL